MIPQIHNKVEIVESGENDNGSWIKYSDGTMICSGEAEIDVTFVKNDFMYMGLYTNPIKFANSFCSTPNVIVSTTGSKDYSICSIYGAFVDKNSIWKTYFLRLEEATVPVCINYIAIGKWK